MIRLAGILLGSTLAVALLLTLFGVPRFEHQSTPSDSGVITLPLQSATSKAVPEPATKPPHEAVPADTVGPAALSPAAPVPAPIPKPIPKPMPEPIPEPMPTQAAETSDAAAPGGREAPLPGLDDPNAGAAEPALEPIEALQWYAFWSPFRSEIAAKGFITQLQRVTGLDYRVVKVKPGVYEVAFAYSDGDELTASLSQISRATGLDMPDE